MNHIVSSKYLKYINNTSNLFLYRLHNEKITSNIQFPNVKIVTLINCSRTGIFNILTPNTFPNISRIHYMSLHPGDFHIYKRFEDKEINWIFPNTNYAFHSYMIKNDYGFLDPTIQNCIKNKQYIDGNMVHDYSYKCDVLAPMLGCVRGEYLQDEFRKFCEQKNEEHLY
jgi:hypothetical protein